MATSDLMVHVHIPKCAGQALNKWLSSSHHFGDLYVRAANIPMTALRWTDIAPVQLQDLRMRSIASHYLRTYPATIHGRTLRYITVLRNPVDRWISGVRYWKLPEAHGLGAQTLREYAAWSVEQPPGAMVKELNAQTNFIAEHEWYRHNRGDAVVIDWSAEPELWDRYRKERLDVAKAALATFGAVGTVERFADFISVLRARGVAWDVPLLPIEQLERVNASGEAAPVDTSWITPADPIGGRLLDALAEDFELYHLAEEILRSDVLSTAK